MYLSWAQYPITETEELENRAAIVSPNDPIGNGRAAYVVRFRDLRYDYPGRDARSMLGATVFLTRDLHVVEEHFGMGSASTKAR